MPRDSYDPFKDESLGQKPKRRPPVMIDWKSAAWQLSEGKSPAAVAEALGISRDRLWRHLHKSRRFQHLLGQEVERQRLTAELQLGATARAAAVERSLMPEAETAEGLQHLAAVADAAGDAKALVVRLADTGLRPEAAARRSKKAEVEARQAEMSRQLRARIAENRRREAEQRAAEEARSMRMASPAAPSAGTGTLSTLGASGVATADRDELRRTPVDANEAERSKTNGNETERSKTNSNEAERYEMETSAAATRLRPPSPPAEPPPWPVVDLDGPDLARLRAEGRLGDGRMQNGRLLDSE